MTSSSIDVSNDLTRAALLRLLVNDPIRSNRTLGSLIEELLNVGLIVKDRRAREYRLAPNARERLERWLTPRWPEWAQHLQSLQQRWLPLTAEGLLKLRREPPAALPPVLNQKTYQARFARNSKSSSRIPAEVQTTRDDVLRFRASPGLRLQRQGGTTLDCDHYMRELGEVFVPERVLCRASAVAGVVPKMLLTAENRGAYIDMRLVKGLLLVHAPGWNIALVKQFSQILPLDLPWCHFGDLDPEGLEVAATLAHDARCRLWIPQCWSHMAAAYGLPLRRRRWPVLVNDATTHPLVQHLVAKRQWLEQEALILDPAFTQELTELVEGT